jgi:hypothetical protein
VLVCSVCYRLRRVVEFATLAVNQIIWRTVFAGWQDACMQCFDADKRIMHGAAAMQLAVDAGNVTASAEFACMCYLLLGHSG